GILPLRVASVAALIDTLAAMGVPLPPAAPGRKVYGLALEEEAGCGADRAAARAYAQDVVDGLVLAREGCAGREAVMLVDAADAMTRDALAEPAAAAGIDVAIADAVYPATPPGALTVPAEILRHVARAAAGQAMTSRLVAVSGDVGVPCVLEVPIG